ncbi:hypothetical protein COW36_09210 [bacterium (Candidatus Blackallbacteria) CG17_big_fil_post_rev_8_21_14_2_50_48_46]|uniref:HTH cro/C1-type domain-containing protein n=1 Tax=bacterium (Candidatus Blackallbacteria) CG17_big_fil_post_rev_8_21_14_2_50_48_46 TaxID=2014261 RepID=A0A2M7G5T0_9BACT|nr:MAG: hypothetical protein COW64_23840 [bacterium (Candidatus Blackallbacteria) CG18_big_fil_WC_8_21_14_2_50_49_26]PIW17344.1 MAG: hypothetical protein COW36_09210 [bacterium (Candidatus Blackallbacteria) CG17_big_fil_post_rev_8_21_14_2_50_48_46]PIW47424.1 MAG: hypothetical protein COW20_12620 [bacterium (Candidatus Blackallbacteria) CG13_big_fil_rev_8_21_14_2_50_49_14]
MRSELIGARLKQWRKHLGLTQEKFAEQIRVHIGVFKKYEQGKNTPGGEALAAIAETGVNINWLLTGEGSMAMADSSTDSQVLPGQLSEVQEKMKRLFDLLLQIDEEKRGVAIAEMLSKVQDAVRMNELERMVKELQKD